jgi:hypothetical protein
MRGIGPSGSCRLSLTGSCHLCPQVLYPELIAERFAIEMAELDEKEAMVRSAACVGPCFGGLLLQWLAGGRCTLGRVNVRC